MGKKRVGNRTNHDPERMEQAGKMFASMTERYKQEIDTYKKFAAARRSRRKYTQEYLGTLYARLKEYAGDCERTRAPMTVAGLLLALGVDRETWSRAKAGELDYLLEEFVDLNGVQEEDVHEYEGMPALVRAHEGTCENNNAHAKDTRDINAREDAEDVVEGVVLLIPYSEFAEKCTLLLQDQLERNCYTNKGNPAGSIFSLKAQFQWREDDAPQHLVQQLVIADSEQARKAIGMLTNVEK